jgi:hypothetical protein
VAEKLRALERLNPMSLKILFDAGEVRDTAR